MAGRRRKRSRKERNRRRLKVFTKAEVRLKITEALIPHLLAFKLPKDVREHFLDECSKLLAKESRSYPGRVVSDKLNLFAIFKEGKYKGSGSIQVTLYPNGNVKVVRMNK